MSALMLVGCTNQKLVPIQQDLPKNVDDELEIEAHFCERKAENEVFPVKLLMVLDGSGSLQFTDQSGLRAAAVRDLMSSLKSQADVKVSTMSFGSNIYVDPPVDAAGGDIFQPVADWEDPGFLNLSDVQTNYHGALRAVSSHLLRDMLNSSAAELARTKYVVIFFSDGAPSPVCCRSGAECEQDSDCPRRRCLGDVCVGTADACVTDEDCDPSPCVDNTCTGDEQRIPDPITNPYGCALEPYEAADAAGAAPGTRYCDGEPEQGVCNDQTFIDRFRENNPPPPDAPPAPDYGNGPIPGLNDLEANDNYNRSYQIEDLVTDVMDLGTEFGVGEIRFHTALLFNTNLPDDIKRIYRLNRCKSETLLQRMAELGNGVYRDFENGGDIDFLSFNFTSLKQSYTLLSTYAVNANALPPEDSSSAIDFRADSDGDGLDDEFEFEFGSDPTVADSDKLDAPPVTGTTPTPLPEGSWGDGYDDAYEVRNQRIGFDARYRNLPVTACPEIDDDKRIDQRDFDHDGLNNCEEMLYPPVSDHAPDPRYIPDADGDTIPDGLEVRLGLNPRIAEAGADSDFDGRRNLDEVRKGLDPFLPDADRDSLATRYELTPDGNTEDGRPCYKSVARGIHLASTQPRFTGGRRGFNDVYFYVAESPSSAGDADVRIRAACTRVQYIKPNFKDPPQGRVVLQESDFVDLSDADVQAELDANPDYCHGLEIR